MFGIFLLIVLQIYSFIIWNNRNIFQIIILL